MAVVSIHMTCSALAASSKRKSSPLGKWALSAFSFLIYSLNGSKTGGMARWLGGLHDAHPVPTQLPLPPHEYLKIFKNSFLLTN